MPYRSLAKRVGNAVRLAEIVQVLVKHGFADLLRRAGLYEGVPAKVLSGLHLIEPPAGAPHTLGTRLRAALTELGPTFVKFGQILSTRPDLVGKSVSDELGQLQDRVAVVPFDKMRPVIESALERRVEECFRAFDPEPVAAASLSQVYRGELPTGEKVAVKVQRPGIRHVIESDLNVLLALAEWGAEHVADLAWMDPVGAVAEFQRSIMRELDFTVEARVIERFRRNFEGTETVFVPKTHLELSAAQVLTMEWIDGVRVDALEEYSARNCDPRTVAELGCEMLCRQVFEFHLFHADPHPGNIWVTRNNQIAFLDYGMVGHLERTDVFAIAELLASVFQEDSEGCARALLAFTTGETDSREALQHDVADYIAFEAQAIVSGGLVGKALEQITDILRRNHLQLSPRFSLLLKALATIESTAHRLDPAMDMVPITRPYCERIVESRYSPVHLGLDARRHVTSLMRLARQMPEDIQQVLRMLRTGRLKMQFKHEGLDHLSSVTDRASNRITFGLITGSIIIGSSLLMFQDIGARAFGLVGYVAAAVFGVVLLISILRSKNY